jgi:hypothetical protein
MPELKPRPPETQLSVGRRKAMRNFMGIEASAGPKMRGENAGILPAALESRKSEAQSVSQHSVAVKRRASSITKDQRKLEN